MVLPMPLYQLQCGVNSYDWGKLGNSSKAAQLGATATSLEVDEQKPYAELWMGTHHSLPSRDLDTGRTLQDIIAMNESLLSPSVVSRFGPGKLPFLFKVLSIRKALSIQAHPDKRLAEKLHAQDPKNYPDDNHKPEMTIAITPFTGFCGFRPFEEISAFLDKVPALAELVGAEAVKKYQDAASHQDAETRRSGLRSLFEKLMTSSPEQIESCAKKLVQSAKDDKDGFAGGAENADLILGLNADFENDIGLFCSFFLNFVRLEPGEGMFLQANDPHAYISGDVIECMASSDNVVRAGFTPKFKDMKTLVSMLTYKSAPPEEQKMKPTPWPFRTLSADTESETLLYDPPIQEFSVLRTTLTKGSVEFKGIPGPSIVIFTQGKGIIKGGGGEKKVMDILPGSIFFIGAGLLVQVEGEDIVSFRAFCSVEEK